MTVTWVSPDAPNRAPRGRVDILIPTYNRSAQLHSNLEQLTRQINAHRIRNRIRIIVHDNASTDDTPGVLSAYSGFITSLRHATNIGLEANTVSLLRASTAEYVMFLGDDDFLPFQYLPAVLRLIDTGHDRLGAVIPGFSELFPDGRLSPKRGAPGKPAIIAAPGTAADVRLSPFGHQMSGLTLKRSGLLEAYLGKPPHRNLYLFLGLLLIAMKDGISVYLPGMQVKVSQGNAKDWRYNGIQLLDHITRNYRIRYGLGGLRSMAAMTSFLLHQPWRVGTGLHPWRRTRIAVHLAWSNRIPDEMAALCLLLMPIAIVVQWRRRIAQ